MPRERTRNRWIAPAAASAAIVAVVALVGVVGWGGIDRAASPLERGRAAYAQRDWSLAERLAREQLRKNRDDREALRLLSRTLFRRSNDKNAAAISDRINPDSMTAEDYFLAGQASVRSQKVDVAIKFWQKAVGLDPAHLESRVALEQVFFRLDRLSEAEKEAEVLFSQPGRAAVAELMRGQIRNRLADAAGAALALEVALERPQEWTSLVDPVQVRKQLARSLLQTRQSALARQQLVGLAGGDRDPEIGWLVARCDLQESVPSEPAVSAQSRSYRESNPLEPEPAPYVGEARCAGCHTEIFRDQQQSRHARTFSRDHQLPQVPIPDKSIPDPRNSGVSHTFKRSGEGVEIRTQIGGQVYQTIVDYAFGSGDRGMTLVGHGPAGRTLECRLSFYPDRVGWDVTTGQSLEHELTPPSYQGRGLADDESRNCLECHVTSARSIVTGTGSESSDRAIGCERCHGPGEHHVKVVSSLEVASNSGVDLAIARPHLASGSAVIGLCAQCHSPPKNAGNLDPQSPSATRFQGMTLPKSRCLIESDQKLDCTTCHNPHRDAKTSSQWYESRCLQCHAAASAHPNRDGEALPERRTSCPVQPASGCIECHMPKSESSVAHTRFTDHYIRVHRGPVLKATKRS